MKKITIISIIVMLLPISHAFSQNYTVKKVKSPIHKNDLSTIMYATVPDEDSKPDSSHAYYFYSDRDSSKFNSTIYSYNESGNFISDHTFLSVYTFIYSKNEYDYNEKNLLIEHRYYFYDYDNSLADSMLPANRTVFSYDEKDRIKSQSMFGWNFETKKWMSDTSVKEEYTYNVAGQLNRIYTYGYGSENERRPSTIIEYSFNPSTNCLTALTINYLNWISVWQVSDSALYYLNDDSLCILIDRYLYNSTASRWDQQSKTEASYNKNGKLICTTYGECWSGHFEPFHKFVYSYNESGQLIYESDLTWNSYNQIWNNINSKKYFYSDPSQKGNENNVSGLHFDQGSDNQTVQLDEIPTGSEIFVYNMQGIKVMQQTYSSGINPVSELPKGMYAIRIINNSKLIYNQVIFKN